MQDQVDREGELRRWAGELYAEGRGRLLRIARWNAASAADAEEAVQDALLYFLEGYDPDSGAPPLAWITLAMKRRCWRLRERAHADRHVTADRDGEHEEPTGALARHVSDARPLAERVADRDEARRRLARLKPDQRTAIGMVAAGYSYEEVAGARAWTRTKVNRSLAEGRAVLRKEVAG
jgi:RNA polymerase sigma factor (sigma-70 family)